MSNVSRCSAVGYKVPRDTTFRPVTPDKEWRHVISPGHMDTVTLLAVCECCPARDVMCCHQTQGAINDSSRGREGSWPRLKITIDCYIKQMWR